MTEQLKNKRAFFHYQLFIIDVVGLREILESIVNLAAMMNRTEIFCKVVKALWGIFNKHTIFIVNFCQKQSDSKPD